jgi:hypothetical protein
LSILRKVLSKRSTAKGIVSSIFMCGCCWRSCSAYHLLSPQFRLLWYIVYYNFTLRRMLSVWLFQTPRFFSGYTLICSYSNLDHFWTILTGSLGRIV